MLRASLDEAQRELARARLDGQRPLPVPLAQLAHASPEPRELNELYGAHGFYELLDTEARVELEVKVCDTPDAARAALAALDPSPVALHVLTEDPSAVRGALVGLALAQGDGRALYLPVAALDGDWLADASDTR
jgi:hypothetical protein